MKNFEIEKIALLTRAEKAEGKLGPLKENHATLVKQLSEMLTAIFGKLFNLYLLTFLQL